MTTTTKTWLFGLGSRFVRVSNKSLAREIVRGLGYGVFWEDDGQTPGTTERSLDGTRAIFVGERPRPEMSRSESRPTPMPDVNTLWKTQDFIETLHTFGEARAVSLLRKWEVLIETLPRVAH